MTNATKTQLVFLVQATVNDGERQCNKNSGGYWVGGF